MNGAVYDSTNMFFRLRYEKAYDGHARDADERRRHRPRRDHLGARPRRAVRSRLPGGDVRLRPRALGAGACWHCRRRCSSASRRPRPASRQRRSCAAGRTSTCSSSSPCRCSCSAARSSRSTRIPSRCARSSEFSPLYRGVDLIRGLTTGVVGMSQVIDVIYLLVIGFAFSVTRLAPPGEDAAQVARAVAGRGALHHRERALDGEVRAELAVDQGTDSVD